MLRYVPENRSGPRVVTGKWLLKNEKLMTRLKNEIWKIWTNQRIKNHENGHEFL
jgi:hypothetical protein